MRSLVHAGWLPLALLTAGAAACAPVPSNGGFDGSIGLVRWSTSRCLFPDAGTGDGSLACAPPVSHVANTGLPTPSPDRNVVRCQARLEQDAGVTMVAVAFTGVENQVLTRPGTLVLRGAMGASAGPPTAVGRTLDACEVRVVEGSTELLGACGRECRVTITGGDLGLGTLAGSIRCEGIAAADGARYKVMAPGGVPGGQALFEFRACDPL